MYGFIEPPPPKPGPDGGSGTEATGPSQAVKTRDWNLHLETAGTNLPVRYLRDCPSAAVLAIEDLCWEAAVEDWKHRRPPRWRLRALAAWRGEGVWLATKADHLRLMSDEVLREL